MKSLCVAVLSGLLVLGVSASVIAQQSGASSSAQSEATKPADDQNKASSGSSSSAVKPDQSAPAAPSAAAPEQRSSSSSSTGVDVKSEPRAADVGKDKSDLGAASPRTTTSERRIFGLEPTAAILIGAAILLVVILALVAMSRGSSETTSHTDIDLNRRL
jgi:hypothetical protein